jgi:hypothetical protein
MHVRRGGVLPDRTHGVAQPVPMAAPRTPRPAGRQHPSGPRIGGTAGMTEAPAPYAGT